MPSTGLIETPGSKRGAYRRKDGVGGDMRATVVEGDAGDHFVLIHVEDVTDAVVEALLRFQATHDELTGLANRGRLIEELNNLRPRPKASPSCSTPIGSRTSTTTRP